MFKTVHRNKNAVKNKILIGNITTTSASRLHMMPH